MDLLGDSRWRRICRKTGEEGNIKINWEPTNWTNQKVKVIIETAIRGYTVQYLLDTSNWKNYIEPINMGCYFSDLTSMTTIDNLENINTENVTSMFAYCYSLPNIDVSHWNTEKVTDMSNMFFRCASLTTLDLSNFNTKKVTNMKTMFYYASNLTKIYVGPNWVVPTNNEAMFGGCGTSSVIRK